MFKRIKIQPRVHSLRLAIIIFLLIPLVLPLFMVGVVYNAVTENKLADQKMERLIGQCNIIKNHMVTKNFVDNVDDPTVNAEISQLTAMYDGRIIVTDRNFRIIADTYMMDTGKICISEQVIRSYRGETISKYSRSDRYIEICLPIMSGEEVQGTMLVTFSTDDIQDTLSGMTSSGLIIDVIAFIVILMISIFLSKYLIKPLNDIENSIERVTEGELEEITTVGGFTETVRIREAFNHMILKMKKLDDSRQEFVSNVSHELKTPMTSIKVLADSLIMQEDVPAELYREFMTDIVAEIDRENDIISDLLTLVKMDKKSTDLNISEVNINELVELILKRLRPIAAKRNIELVFESFRPVVAQVDEVKLTSAISNLVENAIKYNVLDGWVHVSLNADHKYFYLKVEDSGIGIPEESQEMIFERFYRVDKTRSRETGGTGLGLAITKNIILMHRGAVKVYSKENEGTTFTVRIPLNYVKIVRIDKSALESDKYENK